MPDQPAFIMLTCQIGAEAAVKTEIARHWPTLRFAFSRPGFLTFKLPDDLILSDDFDLHSVFARTYCFSLGKVQGTDRATMVNEALKIIGDRPIRRIHVWGRDERAPGQHGYEPGLTDEAINVFKLLRSAASESGVIKEAATIAEDMRSPAQRGELVMDCVLVEPNLWQIGFHRTAGFASRLPGGMLSLTLPTNAPSRAWLKMEEGLQWSRLPIVEEARVAEIGSAPGGASQALLSRGCFVTGIDPGEMAPELLEHPRFTHIRRRSTQVRRRDFRKIRWLTADMNVAPAYTLDAVEAIVTYPETHVRGMLLTLKLPEWELAAEVPTYLDRIRSWGFNLVRARQLLHNRQEICVAALKKPFNR